MSEVFQLFECGDVFQFTDPSDSYQTWQGLRGPKGDPGEPGPPLELRGPVETTGDLPPSASSGELWLVGDQAPYHGWFYNGTIWEDAGEVAVGPEGPQGPAGTITVGTVTGLPAGSAPTVTNSGTEEAAVLNFGIPAGADGKPGRGNILDDWYFVGGGSQLGHGIFPINQRAQTSYSNSNAYTIDRWKLTSGSLTVSSGGITLNGTIVQILQASIGLPTVASALLSDGSMITPTYNDSTKTFTLTATGQTIVAVKLEIGDTQTLAHEESGTWELNDIPDYEEQLIRCKTSTADSSDTYANQAIVYEPPYHWGTAFSDSPNLQNGQIDVYKMGRFAVASIRFECTSNLSWYVLPDIVLSGDFAPAADVAAAMVSRNEEFVCPLYISYADGSIHFDTARSGYWYTVTVCYMTV